MGLKAAPEDQALLLELQDLDTRLQRISNRVKDLPEIATLTELEAEAQQRRRALAEQTGVLEDAQAELSRVQADAELVEARIARDTERLQATSSVKDVHALEQELESLTRRRGELDEIQLIVMERVELEEASRDGARSALDAVEQKIAETSASRDTNAAALNEERAAVATDRARVAERVPEALLALYEKQRSRYGIGASHLRAGVSSASGVALTATDLNAVRAAAPDDVLLCPDSSAVLVRTEESGL